MPIHRCQPVVASHGSEPSACGKEMPCQAAILNVHVRSLFCVRCMRALSCTPHSCMCFQCARERGWRVAKRGEPYDVAISDGNAMIKVSVVTFHEHYLTSLSMHTACDEALPPLRAHL
jgi:hypothetical protein